MKHKLLLSVFVAGLLASCSTAYKSGQTPDDVYYSPARAVKEEVQQDEYTSADNNYLRMKVRNYNRWNFIDDYSYWYDTRYDFQCNYNSYYSAYYIPPYYSWNGWYHTYQGSVFYNPYYQLIPYKNPTYYGSTSASNITAYNIIKGYNNINTSYNPKTGSVNSSNNFGGLVKKAFSSNPNSSSSWDRPARTFDSKPASSSSSTSSSAGGRSGGFGSTGSSSGGGRGGRN